MSDVLFGVVKNMVFIAVQGRYPTPSYSKQAIQTMLRARQPGAGAFMAQQPMMNAQSMQKHLVRQRLAQIHSNRMIEGQSGMYSGNMPGTNPNSSMMSMGQGMYMDYWKLSLYRYSIHSFMGEHHV